MRTIPDVALAVFAAVISLPAMGQSQSPFTLKDADLNLLAECDVLDGQFERWAVVYHDATLEKHLAAIASPLFSAAPQAHVVWKVFILRDPGAQAFAFPNGSVYLTTGLLAKLENDDEVTAALAHEMAHVTMWHPFLFARSLRKVMIARALGASAASFLVGPAGGLVVQWLAGKPEKVGILAAVIGYNSRFEKEADEAAVQRLKDAGLDAIALLRLVAIMNDKLEPEPVSVWSDQPDSAKSRLGFLKSLLGVDTDPSPGTDGGYLDRLRPAILENIKLDLDCRQPRSAVAGAQRLVSAYPNDPAALFWLGESYRSLGPRQPRPTQQELSEQGQRDAYHRAVVSSEQREASHLASAPAGRAALDENQRKAEELLWKATQMDPSFPAPYFALGSLYGQEGKKDQAVEAYRKYIDLTSETADKERARRRIEQLGNEPARGVK